MLEEGFKIWILVGFHNLIGWFIQEYFFPRNFTELLRPEPIERSSFMQCDLTFTRRRQTFTV